MRVSRSISPFTHLATLYFCLFNDRQSSPVDLKEFPDYTNYVKKPMDLGTILKKLLSSEYLTLLDFHADVNLTFENAMKYNEKGTKVHAMALELKEIFEGQFLELLDELEEKLMETEKASLVEV
jgi:hypothetical protein